MPKKIIVLFVMFLVSCQTIQIDQIRTDLDTMAIKYEMVRAELLRKNTAGEIDPATWAYLQEADMFFSDQWSMVVVDLAETRPGYDWKTTLSVVNQILITSAPIVDAIAGGPYLTTIMTAANIGKKLTGKQHKKRGTSKRLNDLIITAEKLNIGIKK